MRKMLFLGLIMAGIISCSKPDKFVINGEIKGKESGKVQLMKYDGGNWVAEDSATITNGKFQLTGKVALPELRIVVLPPRDVVANFFAENGTISIQAYSDSLDKSTVTGSDANDAFKSYQDELANLTREAQGMQQRFMAAQSAA